MIDRAILLVFIFFVTFAKTITLKNINAEQILQLDYIYYDTILYFCFG